MVSFRFHLVSLVAVFLALGLGVLTGTTVLNRGIVAQLERQTEGLSGQLEGLREEVADLQATREVWSAFGEEAIEPLLAGRLDGTRVLLIAGDGTDDGSIDGLLRALRAANGDPRDIIGPIFVSARMALERDTDRADLARIAGVASTDEPASMQSAAADLLAGRLAFGPAGNEVLEDLLASGFLVDEGPSLDEEALQELGGPGQVVITLAGGPAPSAVRPDRFLVHLVSALARDGAAVAAAEPLNGEEQEPPFVTLLRSDGEVSSRIATQDNVDLMPGQIALVLAIEDLLEGVPGHYGVKDGATRPIPEL